MTDQAEPLRFERSWVTDARYPQRVANAAIRFLWRRPVYWLPYVVGFLIILAIAVFEFPSALPLLSRLLIAIVSGIVVYGIIIPLQIFQQRRRVMRSVFPNEKVSIAFSDTSIFSTGPLGSSTILYRAYSSAIRRGEFVFVRYRRTRGFGIYPMALFTEESLNWLITQLESADSTQALPQTGA